MTQVGRDGIQIALHIVQAHDGELYESTTVVHLPAIKLDALNVDYWAEFVPDDGLLRSVTATLVIESDRTWYLDNQGRLAALSSAATPLWPAGRFVVTARDGKLVRWEFSRFGRLRLVKQDRSVRIVAPILDRGSCGLSVWSNATWTERREKIILDVSQTFLSDLDECAWIEPYPDGARGIICLTDHADFDSPAKTRLIADHLICRDICITKSVFPAADPPSSMPWDETGLDDSQYRDSIDRLFLHGTEIAAHGFTPKRDAPPVSECKRRLELFRGYQLTTWIDHGTGDYLFSRGGSLAPGIDLPTLLEENGVRNYWSYFDVWDNPFGKDSSVLAERVGSDVFADFVDSSHGWMRTTAREAAWFALHEFRNIVGDGNDVAIRQRPWHLAAWRRALRWYTHARRVRRAPLGIYGRDGAVFQQSLQAPWVFDTVLLNHLALQLSPPMIDRLIRTSGLLLAHCYMSCEHKYDRGNVFRRTGGRVVVDPAFQDALDYVGDRQRTADISTVSFTQLRRCLELFVAARLRRTETGWKTELLDGLSPYEPGASATRSGNRLGGVTFTLPRRVLMEHNVALC
jgi:hypothetical protein